MTLHNNNSSNSNIASVLASIPTRSALELLRDAQQHRQLVSTATTTVAAEEETQQPLPKFGIEQLDQLLRWRVNTNKQATVIHDDAVNSGQVIEVQVPGPNGRVNQPASTYNAQSHNSCSLPAAQSGQAAFGPNAVVELIGTSNSGKSAVMAATLMNFLTTFRHGYAAMVDLDGRFSVEVFARLVHSELLRNQSSTSDSLHIDNALSDVLSRLRLYRPVTDIDFIASLRSAEQWLRQRTVDSEYTENRSLLDFVLLKNVHGMLLVDGLNVNYWTDRAAGASLCDYAISHRTLLQRHVVLTIERLQRVYHSQFVAIVSNALIRYQRVDAPLAARAVSSDEMRFNGTPQPAAAGSSFDNVKRQRQRQDTTDYCSGDITSISGKVYRDLMPPEWINAVSHRILLHRHPPNGALLPGSARRQVQDAMARAGLSPAHDEAWAAANSACAQSASAYEAFSARLLHPHTSQSHTHLDTITFNLS